MEDLLQAQIRDSCRLALPEGLRDLMCDISREVLRSQPADLYKFIVDYLSALLIVRDTLPIACRLCREVCECSCQPELEEELRNIGLEGEDLDTAKNVVMEYFDKGEVKEGNLLMKLFHKTAISEDLLPAIQEAVRSAFVKHQLKHQKKIQLEEDKDEKGTEAAKNTLRFYEKSQDEDNKVKHAAATKLQAQVRGYLARSLYGKACEVFKEKLEEIKEAREKSDDALIILHQGESFEQRQEYLTTPMSKSGSSNIGRLSSYSLAGSLLSLPKYVPYSAHDVASIYKIEERETESKSIDYTLQYSPSDQKIDGKKIMFQERNSSDQIDSYSVIKETECVDEEIVQEDLQSLVSSVDENLMEQAEPFYIDNQREIETMLNAIIEEKNLSAVIDKDQKHQIELIVHELFKEKQLLLLSHEERKHEIELMINELTADNQSSNDVDIVLVESDEKNIIEDKHRKQPGETVVEDNNSQVMNAKVKKHDADIEQQEEIEYTDHDFTEEQRSLCSYVSDQDKNEEVVVNDEVYDDDISDDVNGQEVVDEQLILMSNYDVIKGQYMSKRSINKQSVISLKVGHPSAHNIIITQEKSSDSFIVEQKGSDEWFLKPPSQELIANAKYISKENFDKRTSGILQIPVDKMAGKRDSGVLFSDNDQNILNENISKSVSGAVKHSVTKL